MFFCMWYTCTFALIAFCKLKIFFFCMVFVAHVFVLYVRLQCQWFRHWWGEDEHEIVIRGLNFKKSYQSELCLSIFHIIIKIELLAGMLFYWVQGGKKSLTRANIMLLHIWILKYGKSCIFYKCENTSFLLKTKKVRSDTHDWVVNDGWSRMEFLLPDCFHFFFQLYLNTLHNQHY